MFTLLRNAFELFREMMSFTPPPTPVGVIAPPLPDLSEYLDAHAADIATMTAETAIPAQVWPYGALGDSAIDITEPLAAYTADLRRSIVEALDIAELAPRFEDLPDHENLADNDTFPDGWAEREPPEELVDPCEDCNGDCGVCRMKRPWRSPERRGFIPYREMT